MTYKLNPMLAALVVFAIMATALFFNPINSPTQKAADALTELEKALAKELGKAAGTTSGAVVVSVTAEQLAEDARNIDLSDLAEKIAKAGNLKEVARLEVSRLTRILCISGTVQRMSYLSFGVLYKALHMTKIANPNPQGFARAARTIICELPCLSAADKQLAWQATRILFSESAPFMEPILTCSPRAN